VSFSSPIWGPSLFLASLFFGKLFNGGGYEGDSRDVIFLLEKKGFFK
jgi:hypothetical protein